VDADAAMGGVQLQVGDGVADGEARHGRCDALASSASSSCSADRVTGGSLVFVICGMVAESEEA
jgi:hypothetical protein